MKLCVVGAGHVGLVTGACFADLGHEVICVDQDKKKVERLRRGEVPIYEPGLEELVRQGVKEGRLSFTNSLATGVKKSEIIFIAVGTPSKQDGDADLSFVEDVARSVAESMDGYKLVVEKSTVPVNTGEWVARTLRSFNKRKNHFDVASNPEFLREGSAINDFMHPDRVVIGVESERAKKLLLELYKTFKCPVIVTDIKSAEIIKHASNSFLATKISFINAVARVCEKVGADVQKVAEGMGLDSRIGRNFLNAGLGFGGSCFPKDLAAFVKISEKVGYDFELLKAVQRVNSDSRRAFVKTIQEALWNLQNKTIAVLGLSFKPDTDDMRDAPSVDVIEALSKEGAAVRVFDPHAMEAARAFLNGVRYCKDPYEAARGADALAIVTEWNEFKDLDFKRIKKLMRQPVVVDGRNIYDPGRLEALGFRYWAQGRANNHE